MPPVNRKNTKQYAGTAPAGSDTPGTSVRISPTNPNRTLLVIVNSGANPGVIRFGGAVLGDGGDLPFAVGAGIVWDRETTCPEASIDIGSTLGTSFSIVEQTGAGK